NDWLRRGRRVSRCNAQSSVTVVAPAHGNVCHSDTARVLTSRSYRCEEMSSRDCQRRVRCRVAAASSQLAEHSAPPTIYGASGGDSACVHVSAQSTCADVCEFVIA